MKLLNGCGILETFTSIDIRGLESNAELRTILFKEEEHNCIMALAKPIEPPCIKPTERADHGSNKGDQLQNGLIMNIEAWQEQEETKESLIVTCKQNRRLIPRIQATE